MTHSEKHVALLALEQQPGIESVAIRLLAPPPLDPQTPKSSQTREHENRRASSQAIPSKQILKPLNSQTPKDPQIRERQNVLRASEPVAFVSPAVPVLLAP
jgi:hypothetical protein